MKHIFILILVGLVQFANASIGHIADMSGEVSIKRAQNTLTPKKGFEIEQKDTILTAKDGKVKIMFKDKTIISLGKNSSLDIAEYLYDESKEVKAEFSILKIFDFYYFFAVAFAFCFSLIAVPVHLRFLAFHYW